MESLRGLLPMQGHLPIEKTYSRKLLTIVNTYRKCKTYRGSLCCRQKIACRKLPTQKPKKFDRVTKNTKGGGFAEMDSRARGRSHILYITHQLGVSYM